MKVPIQNIYYLFCYAWRLLPEEIAIDVGTLEIPDVLNMCAHVLTTGIEHLIRRGLDRGYELRVEETGHLRGRIDLTATMSGLKWLNARAVCAFDELSPDVLQNQILRSTVRLLTDAPTIEAKLRSRLIETDHRLGGINTIQLTDSVFRRVQLHRNNSFYAFLIRVCELVRTSQSPDRSGDRPSRFRDVLADDDYMATVFEEFIRSFYSIKRPQLAVGSSRYAWKATAANHEDLAFLPAMITDVTVTGTSRTVIIDAKYYKDALQTHYGALRVHSGNLYQLMAYIRAEAAAAAPGHSVEGILVYPVGDHNIDLKFEIDDYPVRIYTLNLDQHWSGIEADLLQMIDLPG